MGKRVTIQDIANEMQLSRNTVSKALNDTGILAKETKDRILRKAVEMGYKQFKYADVDEILNSQASSNEVKEIAILTQTRLDQSHFSALMLDSFQHEITQRGYSITMHLVSPLNKAELSLPSSLNTERTRGILCFEVFDYSYAKMLASADIPLLFADSPVIDGRELKADRLVMDNTSEIIRFIRIMQDRGVRRIGYIGDNMHCLSFFERYRAFRTGLEISGLEYDETLCFTGNRSGNDYLSNLKEWIISLEKLPQIFIVANDFVAIEVMKIFRDLGIKVPEDVGILGFDDSSESRVVYPALSTVHIHSEILGYSAVSMLLSRIKDPGLNYRTCYTETTLVLRESTDIKV